MKRVFATAGLTGIEQAVVKATFDDDDKPKSKHLKLIIDWVNLEYGGLGSSYVKKKINLVDILHKRVQVQSWRVHLKTLIVVHVIFRDGDTNYMETFYDYGDKSVLYSARTFTDYSSAQATVNSTFSRKYSAYLSHKLKIFNQFGFSVEKKLDPKNKNFFTNYDIEKIIKLLPAIMKQLEIMSDIVPTLNKETLSVDLIIAEAMLFLIKDSLKLYPSIQLCLWELLSNFQQLSLKQAKLVSKIFDEYFKLNELYKTWFDQCVRFQIIHYKYSPKFDTLSKNLFKKLKGYIKDLEAKEDEVQVANLEDVLDKKTIKKFDKNAKQFKKKKQNKQKSKKNGSSKKTNNNNNNNNNYNNNSNNTANDLLVFDNQDGFNNDEAFDDSSNWFSNQANTSNNNANNTNNNNDNIFDDFGNFDNFTNDNTTMNNNNNNNNGNFKITVNNNDNKENNDDLWFLGNQTNGINNNNNNQNNNNSVDLLEDIMGINNPNSIFDAINVVSTPNMNPTENEQIYPFPNINDNNNNNNNINYTSTDKNVAPMGLSGKTAKQLTKKQKIVNNNTDPFDSLINWDN